MPLQITLVVLITYMPTGVSATSQKKSCSSSSLVDVHTFWSIWQWIENMTLCLRQASIYQIGANIYITGIQASSLIWIWCREGLLPMTLMVMSNGFRSFLKNNTGKSTSGNPFGRSGDAAAGSMLDICHEIAPPIPSKVTPFLFLKAAEHHHGLAGTQIGLELLQGYDSKCIPDDSHTQLVLISPQWASTFAEALYIYAHKNASVLYVIPLCQFFWISQALL